VIFSLKELSELFGKSILERINGVDGVDGVCVDSRKTKPGDLFIALPGERTDGRYFIQQAMDNGAVLAIAEEVEGEVNRGRVIIVKSSRDALRKLAKYNLTKSAEAKYIGVTGSVGKTTTKELIHHILSEQDSLKGKIFATQKNFNSQIGLPICASTMPRNAKFGIFEMGMSATGDIKKLLNIIQPSVSVVSKICEAHSEFFNSVWDIARAKSEIFGTLRGQDAALIPADSPYVDFLRRQASENGVRNIFTFGWQDADASVVSYDCSLGFFRIAAKILGENVEYETHCGGEALIESSLSAILCAHIVSGISIRELAASVGSFTLPYGRGGICYLQDRDIVLIEDAYNACQTSVKNAIRFLARYANRRKVLVIGDMLELGKNSMHYHEDLSATVDKFGIDVVFACGMFAKRLFENLQESKKGIWRENSIELAEKISQEIRDSDCVLVKGSRSTGIEIITDVIKSPNPIIHKANS
jgi:UDP-N-acetylmuramoyl-tripeptide--D-alanyl-D-alanine ligase